MYRRHNSDLGVSKYMLKKQGIGSYRLTNCSTHADIKLKYGTGSKLYSLECISMNAFGSILNFRLVFQKKKKKKTRISCDRLASFVIKEDAVKKLEQSREND